ncbi:nitrite reductase small subunit NirD [Thermostilla marina]
MAEYITVAKVGEIPPRQGKLFQLEGHDIAVFHYDGRYFALDDYCPHMGESLSLGEIHDGCVLCSRHMWAFRLTDGVCEDVPALQAKTFPVRVVGDEIQVCLTSLEEGDEPP